MSANPFAVLNNEPSNELEVKQSQHLRQYLEDQKLYEQPDEAFQREEILGHLDLVVKQWVRLVASALGMAESTVQEANAKIFTFGSYRLGVHAPGADIDVLCVGPAYAKRDVHFFGQESYCLEKVLQTMPGITDVTAVPKAYVPVLRIKFRGLDLDVLYASLGQFLIPDNLDLSPNSVLRGCDEQTVRSLNGCRVTDTILRSVPDTGVFRLALKAVKLWAERRGIYSNVSGYLGGVNMALLVAKVCRWYPRKDAAAILLSLFMFFSGTWQWPLPLHLLPQRNDDTMNLPVWDPNNERDNRALMPIITPVYPAMNSTYNVTRCTMAVMKEEFQRAFDVCREILVTKRAPITNWAALFEPFKFFETKLAFYVLIEVFANNDSDLEKWDGWVRSRVRLLVRTLEEHTNVRPHPDSLRPPDEMYPGDPRPRKFYFLSLTKLRPQDVQPSNQPYALQRNAGATTAPNAANKSVNITMPIKQFRQQVLDWAERQEGMDLKPSVKRQHELPTWVFPEGTNPLLSSRDSAAAGTSSQAAAQGAPAAANGSGSQLPAKRSLEGGDQAGEEGRQGEHPAKRSASDGMVATGSTLQASVQTASTRSLSNGAASAASGNAATRVSRPGAVSQTGQQRPNGPAQEGSQAEQSCGIVVEDGGSALDVPAPRPGTGHLTADSPEAVQGVQEARMIADGQAEVSDWLGDTGVHLAAGQQPAQPSQPQPAATGGSGAGGSAGTGKPPAARSAGSQASTGPAAKRAAPAIVSQPAKKPAGLTFKLSKPST